MCMKNVCMLNVHIYVANMYELCVYSMYMCIYISGCFGHVVGLW